MDDLDAINKKYWSTVAPENILAGVYFPGDEFFSEVPSGASVLDLGCGTGKVSEFLAEKGYRVTGVDINLEALEESKKRNSGIAYVHADILRPLPFATASFDAVIVTYVLTSIIDPEKQEFVAAEIRRMLKPGGVAWICEATQSEDYAERYEEAKKTTGLDKVAFSFSKDAAQPKTVQRVIRHYAAEELDALCAPMRVVSRKNTSVVSPSSGMTVKTIVSVYKI